jgi:hypothetical protein
MSLHKFSIKGLLIVLVIYTVCVFSVWECDAFEISDIWNKKLSSYVIGISVGNETRIFEKWNHADKGYNLAGVSYEFVKKLDEKWDFSVELCTNRHVIYDDNFTEYFSTASIRLWLLRDFFGNKTGTFYAGIGGGFGTIFPRERKSCNYVGTSGIIGRPAFRLGYKKYFSWGNLRVEYMLDHFSCPINKQNGEEKTDTGINYDVIKAAIEIPF